MTRGVRNDSRIFLFVKVNVFTFCFSEKYVYVKAIGPFHDPVTWYEINYAGTQVTQRDFQSKGKTDWTGMSSFVLEGPLCNLRPSIIYSVPCDRIVQRIKGSILLLILKRPVIVFMNHKK